MNRKAQNDIIDHKFLDARAAWLKDNGWPVSKWIVFCRAMLDAGFQVSLYEARKTKSKYCKVEHGGRTFKVRFSDHKPIYRREMKQDCDFFVGRTHTGVRTTYDAINATIKFFKRPETFKPSKSLMGKKADSVVFDEAENI